MSRTDVIDRKPDELGAKRTAYDFILNHPDKIKYPLDPTIFFTGDYCILPWTEACKIGALADCFNLKKKKAEARTRRIRGSGSYLTVYDDTVRYFERLKFTFAHELGHIVCGHLDRYERTSLNRGGLTVAEYKILEDEADCFAGQLLAPAPLLVLLGLTGYESVADIKTIFGISAPAADKRRRDVNSPRCASLTAEYIPRFNAAFANRIRFFKTGFICAACGNVSAAPAEYEKFCSVCGGGAFERIKNIDMDENAGLRREWPASCPNCKNSEIGGPFCIICGVSLSNRCGCGMSCAPDARYCARCGRETEFTIKKFLRERRGEPAVRRERGKKYRDFKLHNCPVCGVKAPAAQRAGASCAVCGAPLYNVCGECGEKLPRKARHCVKCGSASSFFIENFLDDWREENADD